MQSTIVGELLEMIGVNLMGTLPKSYKGHENLLVAVHYFAKLIVAIPLRKATTKAVGGALRDRVFNIIGYIRYLLSDRGPQFISNVIADICKSWGV